MVVMDTVVAIGMLIAFLAILICLCYCLWFIHKDTERKAIDVAFLSDEEALKRIELLVEDAFKDADPSIKNAKMIRRKKKELNE